MNIEKEEDINMDSGLVKRILLYITYDRYL